MTVRKNQICVICNNRFSVTEGLFIRDLSPKLKNSIYEKIPNAKTSSFVCLKDIQKTRLSQMEDMIEKDLQKDRMMNEALQKELAKDNYVTRNINDTMHGKLTKGQKLADIVARFGGSWGFIITFTIILVIWMGINVTHFLGVHFDPYPFILLNLFLSCIAAIQAPIIMMSQNRQADRDRFDAENDYRTNTKSEMEIRVLHEKIDQLNEVQWPHILEIQKMQISILSELENEIQNLKDEKNPPSSRKRHPTKRDI
ncbi:DUF1003 domain-containing protein [Companilactobacillus tucceti]|uniref:DUF1003 domain-containing protein n=1 Tax=Companilactobacillus tucceti TaxID=238012 RepID=UPI00070C557E|nr:DUF1003 domain-containing protein [Companilactobacillus tucceti]